ncbi:MAG: acyl-CoA desaturase, partial [Polyangiaceae bacterium]
PSGAMLRLVSSMQATAEQLVAEPIDLPASEDQPAASQIRPQTRRATKSALRTDLILAGLVVTIPPIGLVAAIAWPGAHEGLVRNGIIFAVLYLFTGFGITAGFHRLFTHKSFEVPRVVRALFAIGGSMALQGPVIRWVADHRRHHVFSDKEGDPHSPVLGTKNAVSRFFHSHMGWFFQADKSLPSRYAKDLMGDPVVRWVDKNYVWWMVLTLSLPFVLGFAFGGTLHAAFVTFLWAGLARIFFVHHVTWSINSVCHVFGTRRYQSRDRSSNVLWLALPSLGESWHNNHHAFPTSATHGFDRFQPDPSSWLIHGLGKVGLASKIQMPNDRDRVRRLANAETNSG